VQIRGALEDLEGGRRVNVLFHWTLVGGIRMSYKRFNADSLRTVISPKKELEMRVLHNR